MRAKTQRAHGKKKRGTLITFVAPRFALSASISSESLPSRWNRSGLSSAQVSELGLAYFRDGRFQTLESADPAGFGGVSGIIPVRGDGLWLNRPSGIVHIPQRELDLALRDTKHAINVES